MPVWRELWFVLKTAVSPAKKLPGVFAWAPVVFAAVAGVGSAVGIVIPERISLSRPTAAAIGLAALCVLLLRSAYQTRLLQLAAFPSVAIEVSSLHQSDHPDGSLRITTFISATNREQSQKLALRFRLVLLRASLDGTLMSFFPVGQEKTVFGVLPMETEDWTLEFRLPGDVAALLADNGYVEHMHGVNSVPAELLRLHVEDRVTGETIEMPVPSHYPHP